MLNRSPFGMPSAKRVVVLRALQLGDMLCAVPAFRALRAALPAAEITLIGLPWAGAFVHRYRAYLDRFIEFPGYPGLPEQIPRTGDLPAFLAHARAARFDLALQMHGSGTITNPLTLALGARINAGYFLPGHCCPDPEHFLPYPEDEPEIRRHLRLLRFLGVPSQAEALEFPLDASDEESLQRIDGVSGLQPGAYVCIHPGARAAFRRWPAQRFAAIAQALAEQGLAIVLTGSAEEQSLTAAVQAGMRSRALDLAGRTDLGALAALLHHARLLACNDTGVAHLAAALRVPSTIIFRNSQVQRWAPLDRSRHRIIAAAEVDDIQIDHVLVAIEQLLREHALPHIARHPEVARLQPS